MTMGNVGKRLKTLRQHKDWTQKEAAQETGFSVNYISLVEQGKMMPSLRKLEQFADKYGTTVPKLTAPENSSSDSEAVTAALHHLKEAEDILRGHIQTRLHTLHNDNCANHFQRGCLHKL